MKQLLFLAAPWAAVLLVLVGPALAGPTSRLARRLALPAHLRQLAATGSAGQGSFQSGEELTIKNYPQDIALADVDGDGDLDLLATNYAARTVSIRRGRCQRLKYGPLCGRHRSARGQRSL